MSTMTQSFLIPLSSCCEKMKQRRQENAYSSRQENGQCDPCLCQSLGDAPLFSSMMLLVSLHFLFPFIPFSYGLESNNSKPQCLMKLTLQTCKSRLPLRYLVTPNTIRAVIDSVGLQRSTSLLTGNQGINALKLRQGAQTIAILWKPHKLGRTPQELP